MNKIINEKESLNSLDLVNIRNSFYLENYRKMLLSIFLSFILMGLLIGFYFYQQQSTSGSRYFPTSPDGVLIEMPPLNVNHLKLSNLLTDNKGYLIDQPKININDLSKDQDNALVIYWVKKVIEIMFDYDYINYRRTLQDLRNYFAPGAHESFLQALDASKNLETIKNDYRIVRAEIIEEPEVKQTGVTSGRYAWNLHVPLNIYYENITNEPLIQKVLAKLWVVRIPALLSPFFGLSIVVVNLEPRIDKKSFKD